MTNDVDIQNPNNREPNAMGAGINKLNGKTIWIDLDNSPHVPFFSPIMKALNDRGYKVVFTARDCFQVCGLADLFGLNYKSIGRHYGKNKILKIIGTLFRAIQLLPIGMKKRPILSVSHGSRSQLIASTLLRIPHILIFDYEHARSLPLLKPIIGIAPQVIDSQSLGKEFKLGFRGYSGLKEDVYVSTFKPDPGFLNNLNIDKDSLIVTIRPPANEAHYHNPESEKLFIEAVEKIGNKPNTVMIILPRNEKLQKQMIEDTWPDWCRNGKIIIPESVLNGLDLIWYSDFVISGGGTMNREAAALGVPVYSIFRGKTGAVDKYLSQTGRLVMLKTVEDVSNQIKIEKRSKDQAAEFEDLIALKQIVDAIDEIANQSAGISQMKN